MKKRVFSCLLALCMALEFLPLEARAAEVASGVCGGEGDGSNLTWVLDDAGTLTISGTGDMADWYYYNSPAPWYDKRENIKAVNIGDGVTSVGDYAFSDYESLTRATLPDGLVSIGKNAFYSSSLVEITFPNSLISIGNDAFRYCNSLTSLTLPDSLVSIGDYAFGDCDLDSVTIPSSITNLDDSAFGHYGGNGMCCHSSIDIIYYEGGKESWDSLPIVSFLEDTERCAKLCCLNPLIYFSPAISCGTEEIPFDAENPEIVIDSDTPFKEDVSTADIQLAANTTDLVLTSVSLESPARSGDNKTLILQFSGTAQGGTLGITVLDSAFAFPVGTANGSINQALRTITVPSYRDEDDDANGDGDDDSDIPYPDEDDETNEGGGNDDRHLPPAPENVEKVDKKIQTMDLPPVTISGEGESFLKDILTEGEHTRWIDRVALPDMP